MNLIDTINMDKIVEYVDVDTSNISFCHRSCVKIALYNYDTLSRFIDILDDILAHDKFGNGQGPVYTIADRIYQTLYNPHYSCILSDNEKLRYIIN